MLLIIGYHILLLLSDNILNKTLWLPFKSIFNHGYIGVDIFSSYPHTDFVIRLKKVQLYNF